MTRPVLQPCCWRPACSRRLVTQTSRIGSIGVMMSHVSYAGHLAQAGVDITLIYSVGA